MSYRLISMKGGSSDSREFEEAMAMTKEGMRMAKEGFETVCELAEEMKEQYGERRGDYGRRGNYGSRGGYGMRGDDWDEMDGYGERRRRDSRGRYM